MARNSANSKSGSKDKKTSFETEVEQFIASHKFQWVNIPLGDDEKEAILERPCTPERLAEFVKECVIHQYKLGINWDTKHSCYIVSMTGVKFFRDDYNLCVTSRHSELWVAIAIAEFKFFKYIASFGIERPTAKEGEVFD